MKLEIEINKILHVIKRKIKTIIELQISLQKTHMIAIKRSKQSRY